MTAGHGEQPGTSPILDVGRIHDGEPATPQPHGQDAMEQVEGILGRGLGVRVVGDDGAQRVRGEHLGGKKVSSCEGGLAAGGDPDQENERIGRNRERNEPTAGGVGGRG